MKSKRQQFEAYYALPGAKYPEAEKVVLAAADAFDSAQEKGKIETKELEVILEAVLHPSLRVWGNCTSLLTEAMIKWEEPRERFIEILVHPKSHARFAALCC